MTAWEWFWIGLGVVIVLTVIYDVTQRSHAILRNFPVVGHFRYWLEAVGPELRQYIVTDNDEERPFSRDERRWIYTSSKRRNTYFGFGTDNDLEKASNYLIIKQAAFPLPTLHEGDAGFDPKQRVPCAKVLGGTRGRKYAFRPDSVVNVSAMSFGSLGRNAIEALNRGAGMAGCLQNTGEGGVSPHHLHGGDLIYQVGTGYFGCRDEAGRFSMERLKESVARGPVKAIEIKLSQGAKPGVGGFLPGAKVTPEIAATRGIPVGEDCASPAGHTAFRDADSMLDFVESIASETGLPVGIKSAVGQEAFWHDLSRLMEPGGRGVDFVTIDGGEGGTGAAPLHFSDHVALPFRMGMARVYGIFARHAVHEDVVWIGAGRLGFPDRGLLAMSLGCDLINVAREAMLAIGCIQAQRCHTGHCPAGVATHTAWLQRGLDPERKAPRLANYVVNFRREMLKLSHACGEAHPALVPQVAFEILDGCYASRSAADVFGYEPGWGEHAEAVRAEVEELMGASSVAAH